MNSRMITRWIACLTAMMLCSIAFAGQTEQQQKSAFEQYKAQMLKDPSLIRFYTFEKGHGQEVINHVPIDRSQRAVTGGPLGSLTIQRTKGSGHARSLDAKYGPPPSWSQGRYLWKAAIRSGMETSSLPWEAAKLYRSGITGQVFAHGGTLAGWFRIEETDATNASCNLVRLGDGYGNGFKLEYSKAKWKPDGSIQFNVGASSKAKRANLNAAPCKAGIWHHFAATFDDKTVKLYLDGKLMDEKPSTGRIIPTTYENMPLIGPFHEFNTPTRFGSFMMIAHNPAPSNGSTITRFDIDELAIYKRALTAKEVAAQEQAGKPDTTPDQQLAEYHQWKKDQQAIDAIQIDLPNQTDGYFRVNKPFGTSVQIPATTTLTGPFTALFSVESLQGQPIQSIKRPIMAGEKITQTFTLDQCGLYYLDVAIENADGKVIKHLPAKQGLGIVPPAPAQLTEQNPIAFWADNADRFYFDVPTRRMNYAPGKLLEDGNIDTRARDSFQEKYDAYANRIPNFRAFVWFYVKPTGKPNESQFLQKYFTQAISLFKSLNVMGLEVTSEPHTKHIQAYVAMLKKLTEVIHQQNAHMVIVPPGAAPPSIPMIADILKEGGINYVNGVSYHPYPANPIGAYLWENRSADLKKVVDQYPDKHLIMWNTESTIGILPRINDRPMTLADAFAAKFKPAMSFGETFFPFFVPRYPEDQSAAFQCQSILIDLQQGYKLYTIHTTPNIDGYPSMKGVAITALAGQVLNHQKSVSRLPMAIAENMCILVKNTDNSTTAAVFSLKSNTVNFKVQPGKTYKTMDMLGNYSKITANSQGMITVNSMKHPFYIFDVPSDMQEVVPLKVAAPDVLPENRVLDGTITVNNPFNAPLIGKLSAKPIRGAAIQILQTDINLAPGTSKTIGMQLKANFLKRRPYLLSVDLLDDKGKELAGAQTIFQSKGVVQMVPKAKQTIVLDGNDNDWAGIPGITCDDVDSVVHGKPNFAEVWMPQWVSKEDLSLNLKTAWREDGLYFLLHVTDDKLIPAPEGQPAFKYDCLEFFFDGRRYNLRSTTITDGAEQVVIPPCDSDVAKPCPFWFARKDNDKALFAMNCVSKRVKDGYVIEGELTPKPGLDFKLLPGSQFMMDFLVDDTDSTDPKWLRKAAMAVHGTFNNYVNPNLWGRYELQAGD